MTSRRATSTRSPAPPTTTSGSTWRAREGDAGASRSRTLSLGPKFLYEMYSTEDIPLAFDYGFDKVRFVSPVPVRSRVRMRATLKAVEDTERSVRARIVQTFEREGEEKPACVAESLVMHFAR